MKSIARRPGERRKKPKVFGLLRCAPLGLPRLGLAKGRAGKGEVHRGLALRRVYAARAVPPSADTFAPTPSDAADAADAV